jgi:hypothetical protein
MVPVGVLVPEPVTVNATEVGVLTTTELVAGVTVIVGVVLAGVPPPPPLLPTLVGDDDDPQPAAAKPMAATSTHEPSMFFHFRVRPGTKNTRRARTAEPPAALNHPGFPKGVAGRTPVVGGIVLIETLALPVVTVEVRDTEEPAAEQVGRLVAPAGEEVSTQLNATAPV